MRFTEHKKLDQQAAATRVAGQKLTLEALAGRTNFSPAIPLSLLFKISVKLGNLCNFNEIHS